VTVVGVGQVGMAIAYSLLSAGTSVQLVLADIDRNKLLGEVMDFQHAGAFLQAQVTAAGAKFEGTENSDICVITAGVRQRPEESRRSLLERNGLVLKSIIPPLVKLSPNTIFIVVSNPCDTMTYLTWKLSGLPANRVIGSGTYLDSSRFRVLIAEKLKVNPQSVHGMIIGEHGDSSVPVWSTLNLTGISLGLDQAKVQQLGWEGLHKSVVESAYEVIKLKGYTNWAIGAATGTIIQQIFTDSQRILPLSTLIQGLYGIEDPVFLSVPCVLGRGGIVQILKPGLHPEEEAKFKASATEMGALIKTLSAAL